MQTVTQTASKRKLRLPIPQCNNKEAQHDYKFDVVVSFTTHDREGCYPGPIDQPYPVAKFCCAGDATNYAIWAASNAQSPHPKKIRVYHVTRGQKYIYRAG